MMNESLLQEVRAKAQLWLSDSFDEETRQEVKNLLEAEDTKPLIEAFYKNLSFGTGGLRGIMGAGTNRMNAYTVAMATQGLSNYLLEVHKDLSQIKVVIGYDCRNNSARFARIAAETFSANGIEVYLFESLRPTPEISFAIRALGCQSGVMITASHNPREYNGYKAYWEDGAQMVSPHDVNTIEHVTQISSPDMVAQPSRAELIHTIGEDVDKLFIDKVQTLSLSPEVIKKHCHFPIVYTPIHGTGVHIVPRALESFEFKEIVHVPEQDVVSGNFPTVVSPNPEEPAALALAIEKADEVGADLVLGSDPDGDRIGVAVRGDDNEMHLITGNQICSLLTYYSIIRRKELGQLQPNNFVVKTIVTTDLVKAIAESEGVELFDTYTGFKWIAAVIREHENNKKYIGGGEESYGYLWEDFIRDKSSVSACCLFAELTVWAYNKGLSILDLLDEIYCKYGYYAEKGISFVHKGRTGSEEIARLMEKYRNEPPTHLAGSAIAYIYDYENLTMKNVETGETTNIVMPEPSNVLQYIAKDGTKLSIRPSGTEPKIKYYIGIKEHVSHKASLERAKNRAQERIQQIIEEFQLQQS